MHRTRTAGVGWWPVSPPVRADPSVHPPGSRATTAARRTTLHSCGASRRTTTRRSTRSFVRKENADSHKKSLINFEFICRFAPDQQILALELRLQVRGGGDQQRQRQGAGLYFFVLPTHRVFPWQKVTKSAARVINFARQKALPPPPFPSSLTGPSAKKRETVFWFSFFLFWSLLFYWPYIRPLPFWPRSHWLSPFLWRQGNPPFSSSSIPKCKTQRFPFSILLAK